MLLVPSAPPPGARSHALQDAPLSDLVRLLGAAEGGDAAGARDVAAADWHAYWDTSDATESYWLHAAAHDAWYRVECEVPHAASAAPGTGAAGARRASVCMLGRVARGAHGFLLCGRVTTARRVRRPRRPTPVRSAPGVASPAPAGPRVVVVRVE